MSLSTDKINISAYQYQTANFDKFNIICQPLFDLGITWFNYRRIFKNGSYLAMDSNLEYRKAYLNNIKNYGKIFNNEVSKATADQYRYYIIPNDIKKFDKKKDPILHLVHEFGGRNAMSVFKLDTREYVDAYFFAMTDDSICGTEFYANNISLLKQFIHYFNQKAFDLINIKDKSLLSQFEQEFNFGHFSIDTILDLKIQQFLSKILHKRKLIKGKGRDIILSTRETECLQYLALGKSVKGIACTLDLSPRTVEFYLRNIKFKTGYKSRNMLLTRFVKDCII